jgi:D-beta-D-heptose 7-phosphate kinase/D-beta-D-heptose 1-phosphate adenosyltransferase
LQDARRLGDALIVGVNSDRSVRANKGPERPINPEHERAEVLSALVFVDLAVIFDEDTPYALIAEVQPDVLVKGADWAEHNIVGATSSRGAAGAWSAWNWRRGSRPPA